MTLHFSYGSNMDREVMHRHAPAAQPIGIASLPDHRFVITTDCYATVEPAPGETVHGVLWQITPRDRVLLDVWESVAIGLYRAETRTVRQGGRGRRALVYVARRRPAGWPKAGYLELILAAGRAWNLPPRYLVSLQRWLPTRPLRAASRKFEEFGCTRSASVDLVPQWDQGEIGVSFDRDELNAHGGNADLARSLAAAAPDR